MSIEYWGLPRNAIVLAGGWEIPQEGKRPKLNSESRKRMLAAGSLAIDGYFDSMVISGGLITDGIDEATGAKDYLLRHFPELARLNIPVFTDGNCYDTSGSAQSVAELVEEETLKPPYTLITSQSHLARATKCFKKVGLQVSPVSAEEILADRSGHYQRYVNRYFHSTKYYERLALESIMRTALFVDRSGNLTRKIASVTRKDQLAAKQAQ